MRSYLSLSGVGLVLVGTTLRHSQGGGDTGGELGEPNLIVDPGEYGWSRKRSAGSDPFTLIGSLSDLSRVRCSRLGFKFPKRSRFPADGHL